MRILVCDDGTSGDELAHHLKMMYGAETFRAKTLAESMAKRIEITNLDYITFDLSYPDSSRQESVGCIPKMIGNGTPLFVFTGYEEKDLMEKSLAAGAMDWFLKGDNHKGGAALGARIASHYFRTRRLHNGNGNRVSESLLEVRKDQAKSDTPSKASWFSTTSAVVSLGVLVILQIIALCGFMYSQGGANALFRNRVETNTADIRDLKVQSQELHDKANESKRNRLNIEARQTASDARANAMDTKLDGIRTDMNAGFQRIYEILLQDRKTNADNRQSDQRK